MIHWREGREAEARDLYQKAVEWTDRNAPQNAELIRFRAEADEVMGLEAPTPVDAPPPAP